MWRGSPSINVYKYIHIHQMNVYKLFIIYKYIRRADGRGAVQARNEAQATLEEVKAEIEVVEGRSKKAAEALSAAQTRLQVPPPSLPPFPSSASYYSIDCGERACERDREGEIHRGRAEDTAPRVHKNLQARLKESWR